MRVLLLYSILVFSLLFSLQTKGQVVSEIYDIKPWSVRFSVWTENAAADSCLLLFSSSSEVPVVQKSALPGSSIGLAKVIAGTVLTDTLLFILNALTVNTTYYVRMFMKTGQGMHTWVYEPNASFQFVTNEAEIPVDYYEGMNLSETKDIKLIQQKIMQHVVVDYNNYDETIISSIEQKDTLCSIGNQTQNHFVCCTYTENEVCYEDQFFWTNTEMSREHSYPVSWMPIQNKEEHPAYHDLHHLFPVLQEVNARRCNLPFGNVNGLPEYKWNDFKIGLDDQGDKVVEVPDQHKGRVARAMFYVALCYHTGQEYWGFRNASTEHCFDYEIKNMQRQEVLKKWNEQFPPDAKERTRNEYIYSLQKNRNPFVDFPEWACLIDFENMVYLHEESESCSLSALPVKRSMRGEIYYTEDEIILKADVMKGSTKVFDVYGGTIGGMIIVEESQEIRISRNFSGMAIIQFQNKSGDFFFEKIAGNK